MKKRYGFATFFGILCVAIMGPARAGVIPFGFGGAAHGGVDVSIMAQTATIPGYDVEFVISNTSTGNGATVTGIYFESGWLDFFYSFGYSGATGGTRNLRLPADASMQEGTAGSGTTGWTTSMVSYETPGTKVWLGVEEGHSATIAFKLKNGTLADVQAAMGGGITNGDTVSDGTTSGDNIYGVSVRVQDLSPEDNYAEGHGLAGAEAIPEPASMVLFGLGTLAIFGKRRRR